jgi:quinol monooxygenase YgiN
MTVLVIAEVHPLSGSQASVRDVLDEFSTATRAQDGCLACGAYAAFDGETLVVSSMWRDEAAMRAHFRSLPYGRYAEAVAPSLARPSDVVIHYVSETVHPVGDPSTEPGRLG